MGATSVTGKGQGASYAGIKGPGNNRNFYVSKITPHVVAAGELTLDGSGDGTVTFTESLALHADNYVVMLTSRNATATAASLVSKANTSSKFSSFVVKGTAANIVQWAVIRTGNAEEN